MVEIFADKGISGTSLKKRDEFKRMIKMCKRGKIDMIITKSISRFARNTVDCLESTRLLKELGVDVFSRNRASTVPIPVQSFISPSTAVSHRANRKISAPMLNGVRHKAPKKAMYRSNTNGF